MKSPYLPKSLPNVPRLPLEKRNPYLPIGFPKLMRKLPSSALSNRSSPYNLANK